MFGTTGEWACKSCQHMWVGYRGPSDPCPNCKALGTPFKLDETTYDRWKPVIDRMKELRDGTDASDDQAL